MIPNANKVNLLSAPPENILNIPKMPPLCESNNFLSSSGSIPGTGICAPSLKTIMAPKTNNMRFFNSLVLPKAPNKLS